jgi:hypothetical protein
MNADEIVQQLRYMAENSRSKHDVLVDTISLIKSLQAQLVASQRRADAAVELIGKVSQAVEVAFNATDYVKPNTGIWHTLGLALDWIKAWRGQQAGKGEAK